MRVCHVPSPSHRARCCNTRLCLCGDPGIRPLLTPLRLAHRTRSFSRAAVPATMSFFRQGAVCRTDRHLCPGPGPPLSSRMGYFGLVVEAEVSVPTPQTLLWLRNERRLVCDLSGGDVQSEEFRDSCIAKPLSFALSERRMCLLFPVVRCSDNPCGLIVRSYQKLPVEGQMTRTLLPRGSTELLSRRGLLRAPGTSDCGLFGETPTCGLDAAGSFGSRQSKVVYRPVLLGRHEPPRHVRSKAGRTGRNAR